VSCGRGRRPRLGEDRHGGSSDAVDVSAWSGPIDARSPAASCWPWPDRPDRRAAALPVPVLPVALAMANSVLDMNNVL
jgi:hypothetical protein